MKRALLVDVPNGRDSASHASTIMGDVLRRLGGWTITTCAGPNATRAGILRALDTLIAECAPHDTCMFYFSGHGGAVRFSRLAGDLGRRAVFYLVTLRPPGSSERVGILDVELSDALARLERACDHVTAIIDCCFAAAMVRAQPIPTEQPPAWIRELAGVERRHLLSLESHPRIVRLFGASSLRQAYPEASGERPVGLLTRGLVDVISEAGFRCDRLSWDAVARRIREWASQQRGTEEQRVVLAGPRHRLLFSRHEVHAQSPRQTATYMPGDARGRGWIRAGRLHAVEVGDRWGILALELDAERRPRVIAHAEVRRVELDCAAVVLDPGAPARLPPGATAIPLQAKATTPVAVDALPQIERALEASGLLHPVPATTRGADGVIRRTTAASLAPSALAPGAPGRLGAWDATGRPIALDVPDDEPGRATLVRLLEHRARARRLLASLQTLGSATEQDTALEIRWGRVDDAQRLMTLPLRSTPSSRPRLHVGDRTWIQLQHAGYPPLPWFVSVLELGIDGQLVLLNAREPEGMEIAPGVPCFVGLRHHRHRQGFVTGWPACVPRDGVRSGAWVVLASRRPIDLGGLVDLSPAEDLADVDPDDDPPLVTRQVPTKTPRPSFATSRESVWIRIDYDVDSRARPTHRS